MQSDSAPNGCFSDMSDRLPFQDLARSAHAAKRETVIACMPGLSTGNPYLQLFARGLASHGVKFVSLQGLDEALAIGPHLPANIVHIHWPENLWGYGENASRAALTSLRAWARTIRREHVKWRQVRKFIDWLAQQKQNGKQVWLTVHNIDRHEGTSLVDRYGFRRLNELVDLHIFHSQHAVEDYRRNVAAPKSHVVMFHGNYDGIFPAPGDRAAVRERLAIPHDATVFAVVGQLRENKGLAEVIRTFERLGPGMVCILAGKPRGGRRLRDLLSHARACRNVIVIDRELADQEYVDIVSAADGVMLPYKAITGSGALMCALTLGRGVIATRLPYFEEMLHDSGEASVLVSDDAEADLQRGIAEFLTVPYQIRGAAARRLANRYAWSRVIEPVAAQLE